MPRGRRGTGGVLLAVVALATLPGGGGAASAADRMVLAENFTATWCGYCPYAGRALDRLMDNFPEDIVSVQLHYQDSYSTTFSNRQANFYSVTGVPTTWFDGVLERVGAYTNDNQQYNWYLSTMNQRLAVPTDVTLDLAVRPAGGQTFDIDVTVGIEAGGQGKTMLVQLVLVRDYFPSSGDDRYRNCQRQDAATQTVTLAAGESTTFTRQFTVTGSDWDARENLKLVVWARQPGSSAPKEVYNAWWEYLIQIPPGDINDDGQIDIVDLSLLLAAYGTCTGDPNFNANADLDGNGCVDLPDLSLLLANYGYGG